MTPPLDGLILPGVMRLSVLEAVREWEELKVSERQITIDEVAKAADENRVSFFLLSFVCLFKNK